jgi:hypothetical protein
MPQGTNARPSNPPDVTDDQTSHAPQALAEPVRNKVIEIADLLRQEAPDAPLSERVLSSFIAVQTKGAGVEFYRAVLAAFPDVEPGETEGAYGDRVLRAVRR